MSYMSFCKPQLKNKRKLKNRSLKISINIKKIEDATGLSVDDEVERKRQQYLDAGFSNREIDEHFNRVDATERVVDSDDKVLDLDLIPTESSDTLYTDSDTKKKDKIKEKEIFQEKENLRLSKIADITDINARIQFAATLQNQDTSGGDNPALSTITGDVDGKFNPFKILDKDANLAQEFYKNAQRVEAREKTAKIETNYLDYGGLSNFFPSEAKKRIFLDQISNIISMTSGSVNRHSEDNTRSGFLQTTPRQWKEWVENHVNVERDLYGEIIPETWTLEDDPTNILGQRHHSAVLGNYILFSPNVDPDLRARLINGDINAAEEFVNKHIYNGEENNAADVKQAILKNQYVDQLNYQYLNLIILLGNFQFFLLIFVL